MNILLIGNFGVGNFGDDVILQYYRERFPEHQFTVCSAHPENEHEVPRLPLGIRSLFTTPWFRTISAYKHTDAVLFGGGSLFTDTESLFACVLWAKHAAVARFFRKPVLFAFQGIGPFRTPLARFFAKSAFKRAVFISVRDHSSFDEAQSLAATAILESADPAVILFSEMPKPTVGSAALLVPRSNSTVEFFSIAEVYAKSAGVRIASLQPEDAREQDTVTKLQLLCGTNVLFYDVRSLSELHSACNGVGMMITQRYHAALAALLFGIPYKVIPQMPGDKLATLKVGENDPQMGEGLVRNALEGERLLKEALGK